MSNEKTKSLLKKVRKIEIKTRRLSNHIFGGEYHSAFKGRGMTFSEVRQYQYGDDVRTIDWNVTARTRTPHIKVFEEERELTLMLVADISHSTLFGTQQEDKKQIIAEIAATLAFSALQNNDKVGLILFSNQIELFVPPKKGKSHISRIIRELLEYEPTNKSTDFNIALEYLASVLKKRAIVFVLSDFITPDFNHNLKIVAQKHDITGIRIFDPNEQELPNLGVVNLFDNETGKTHYLNTGSSSIRKAYRERMHEHQERFNNNFKKTNCGSIEIGTEDNYITKLLSFFKSR